MRFKINLFWWNMNRNLLHSTVFLIVPCLILQPTFIAIVYPFSNQFHPLAHNEPLTITFNIEQKSTVYEGDIINCTITGNPTVTWWTINNQSPHYTFYNGNPVIFDPEPTPLNATYVNFTVHAENLFESSSATIQLAIKRLYFGDIHFHSSISDGYHHIDTLYQNTIQDNYLDFICLTDHAEIINSLDFTPPQPLWMFTRSLIQYTLYKMGLRDEWQIIKNKATEYYTPGSFTTFLGFEYSPGPWYPGGWPWSEHGHEDISHINFYYKDVYPSAPKYSGWDQHTFDDILEVMAREREKGHLNVGFPHHPLMKIGNFGEYSVNWTFLYNNISNVSARDSVLRGVETYSKWGTAIGKYSGIPIRWPYDPRNLCDSPMYWVENALWEWSKHESGHQRFVLMANSDNHAVDRAGSASLQSRVSGKHPNPSGIMAAYAIHNTRPEIWDAMNNCSIYGIQTLKIRANVRFDGQMAYGRWINCTSPLNIRISAYATFPGIDHSGKNMCPHGYSPDELDYPIMDIWLIKKDVDQGQPWCKVIGHASPNTSLAVIEFKDEDVHPNDFYYVAIRQKGDLLKKEGDTSEVPKDEYMAFIGPVFINSVKFD